MKKIYCLLLAAFLVLGMTSVAFAEDQGLSLSLDYGLGGNGNFNYSSASANKNDLTEIIFGTEYLMGDWKFAIKYTSNANNSNYYSEEIPGPINIWTAFASIGYDVVNQNNFNMYIDGLLLYNNLNVGTPNSSIVSGAFMIGPDIRYAFSDKVNIKVFFGLSPIIGSTIIMPGGSGYLGAINTNTVSLGEIKFNYLITNNLAISAGYWYKYICANYSFTYISVVPESDTQSVATVGLTFKF